MEKPTYRHVSLRNPNINYRSGWWSVTIQATKNKSIFGAIVGERVALNALGRAVEAYWVGLPKKYPELELFDFVVMPNHFHALLRVHFAPTNRAHHLGFLMSRFKGGTSFIYGKMRRAGEIEDIGESLWQRDYWDDLVTSETEFKGWQKYIRENPANWSSDRYGACTAYTWGDAGLLMRPRIAFVASQGFYASDLRPRKIWPRRAAEAAPSDEERVRFGVAPSGEERVRFGVAPSGEERVRFGAAPSDEERVRFGAARAGEERVRFGAARAGEERVRFGAARPDEGAGGGGAGASIGGGGFNRPERADDGVLISTFTSAQEREALRRALTKKRPLIAVFPAGLPGEGECSADLSAAIREGRALAISPQPPGSRLNKKIATWCNEFLLKNADEIWVGDLSPNGMLVQMLAGLGRLKPPTSMKSGCASGPSALASIEVRGFSRAEGGQ